MVIDVEPRVWTRSDSRPEIRICMKVNPQRNESEVTFYVINSGARASLKLRRAAPRAHVGPTSSAHTLDVAHGCTYGFAGANHHTGSASVPCSRRPSASLDERSDHPIAPIASLTLGSSAGLYVVPATYTAAVAVAQGRAAASQQNRVKRACGVGNAGREMRGSEMSAEMAE